MAVLQRWPAYRGWWCIRIVLVDGFGTYPTGWHIEGDLPNQVAVSTDSTVGIYELVWVCLDLVKKILGTAS